MPNNEHVNRIHEILEETMQDRGTHYLSARVRARAMFQDYSLMKDTVLDPGLNLREAQKLSEFIFSQSSFLLRGETDDKQQTESWLNVAAQSFEFLSKISDESEKDYLLINAAFSYHIAGYQANAQCLAKLLEERLATEIINKDDIDVSLAINTKKAIVGFLKRDISMLERVSSSALEQIQLSQSEIINQITNEQIQRPFLDIFEYSGSAYFHKSLLSICNYWRTGSEDEYKKANSEMEKSSEYFALAIDATFAVLARELITAYKILEEKGTWSNISANGDDLIQDRVWQTYLRNLAFEKSIVDFWASQLHALRSKILTSDDSFVIQMPTSAGKTLIAELVILAELTSKKVKCLYIAPYRALVSEVERNLADSLGALGFKVSNLLGNFEFDGFQHFMVNEADVLVATPEKAELFLRTRPEFFDNLGVVIVDEGHIIDEGWKPPHRPSSDVDNISARTTQAGRGVLLEFLMSRIKARLPSTRFIFMSAVMNEDNANDFVKWLSKNQEHPISIDISQRPSRLITAKFFWDGNSGKIEYLNLPVLPNGLPPYVPNVLVKKRKVVTKVETVASLAISMAKTDPILVFCAMKKEVRSVAEKIIELLNTNPVSFLPFTENPNLESYYVAQRWLGNEHTLTKALRYGIGIHYGPLPDPVREAVESDFKQKKISILVSTNTLGQGVNLPIKTAIIYSVVRRWGGKDDSENIKKRDFWNICGRAGRAGKETEGQVIFVVITPNDNDLLNEFKDYENIENINSALFELLNALIRQQIQQEEFIKYIDSHIIALMAENVIDMEDDESVLGFLKSSLVGVQAIKNNVDLAPLVVAIKETVRWISTQVPDANLRKVFARTGLSTQSCLQIESAVNEFLDRARAIVLTAQNQIDINAELLVAGISACSTLPEMSSIHPQQTKNEIDFINEWISGKSIDEIKKISQGDLENFDVDDFSEYLADRVVYRLPWGLNAFLVILASKLAIDFEDLPISWQHLPTMMKYGVSNIYACWGCSIDATCRDLSIELSNEYRKEGNQISYVEYYKWLLGISSDSLKNEYKSSDFEKRRFSIKLNNMLNDPSGLLFIRRLINELVSPVQGIQYDDRNQIAAQIKLGDKVELVPEPDNKFDTFAVKVVYNGSQVGYLRRDIAKIISKEIKFGARINSYVKETRPATTNYPYPWIEIGIQFE